MIQQGWVGRGQRCTACCSCPSPGNTVPRLLGSGWSSASVAPEMFHVNQYWQIHKLCDWVSKRASVCLRNLKAIWCATCPRTPRCPRTMNTRALEISFVQILKVGIFDDTAMDVTNISGALSATLEIFWRSIFIEKLPGCCRTSSELEAPHSPGPRSLELGSRRFAVVPESSDDT